MAQSKSFFGLRKGSTKSLTFQVLNGKQITKDRVYNVKNPQSLAQMQQRALMATVISAYSHMKEICDHSFEGIEVGSKTMAEFMKTNLNTLKISVPSINLSEYKMGNYAQNSYIISKGTLVPLEASEKTSEESTFEGFTYSNGKQWDTSLTYAKLAESLGLKKDGMLTIVLMSDGSLYWVRLKFTEKIIASSKIIAKKTSLVSDMQSIDKESVEGNAVELSTSISIDEIDSKMQIFVQHYENESSAIIKSEKIENTWKRSTAYLNMRAESYDYDSSLATYPINTTLLLNGGNMPSNILK